MMRAFAFIGHSGAGKTTLLEALIPLLLSRGVRVGALKHSSHSHPFHPEGTDTSRLHRAGLSRVGFAQPSGLQLTDGSLATSDAQLSAVRAQWGAELDLLLVEGWKESPLPKAEVWRETLAPPLSCGRSDVVAILSEHRPPTERPLTPPWIHRREQEAILELILTHARPL